MINQNNARVLLIADTSYAGMGPYVASIVNSFEPSDNTLFFLVESSDKYYSHNIRKDLLHKVTIVQAEAPTKIKTLKNLIIDRGWRYSNLIKKLCLDYDVKIIHSLTSLTDARLSMFLSNKYKFLYTVHDFRPHEQNKVFYKEWRMNIIYKRIFNCINFSRLLLTNSKAQLNELRKQYPNKESFYAPFPSLITENIIKGNKNIAELSDIKNYILFFGRIEAYKGIELLSRAFLKSDLPGKTKLVIAGKGEYKGIITEDIILINRYIDDSEVANLYKNAAVIVYPYISATQSGVLSVAAYFGKPMIVSDVPFFLEELGMDYPLTFHMNDSDALSELLSNFYRISNRVMYSAISREVYEKKYSKSTISNYLNDIYRIICK